MKTVLTLAVTTLSLFVYSASALCEVKSLRGDELDTLAKEPERTQVMNVQGGLDRSYKYQPPMVPHEIEKYQVNLKVNGCLACHGEATYQEKHAPKVGDSHYETRDGKVLKTVSSRRYFCTQCHAPQMNTAPLVQNKFEGAK